MTMLSVPDRPQSAQPPPPPPTLASEAKPGLGRQVLDRWREDGYGIPGATASGDKVILPFRRPAGAGALTVYLASNGAWVADVLDEAVLEALAEIDRVDDVTRILDEYQDLTFQRAQDSAPAAFYTFTLLGFGTICRRVYDLHQAALQAVWYADGWDRPAGWKAGGR